MRPFSVDSAKDARESRVTGRISPPGERSVTELSRAVTQCHGDLQCFAPMGHLRIQILGPLKAWDVTDDGVWHDLKLSEEGWAVAGLLASLIFYPEETKFKQIAPRLWDRVEIEEKPAKLEARLRTTRKRCRQALEPHQAALPHGDASRLVDKDDTLGPRRVYVDWDDVRRYQKEKKYREALSLISGLPLPEFPDKDGNLGGLTASIRGMVIERIEMALEGLKQPVPEKPSWTQLEEYAAFRPEEWIPRRAPKASPVVKPPPRIEAEHPTPRPPSPLGRYTEEQLFVPCHEGKARLSQELDEADREGRDTWWGSSLWLGEYLALWHKTLDTPCEEIEFSYVDDVYDGARFGVEGEDAPKDKATLIEAPKQLGDNDNKKIICGKTNWGLAHIWAKDHAEDLFAHHSNLSVFGVKGRPVYPNILGVHTLVQTSDGYLLFALRSPDVDFHELTWSASFEESVSIGPREFTGPLTGDRTIFDPIRGGLYEEWGIAERAIRDSSCLAIGREWVRESHAGGSHLNLSPTILTACRLNIPLNEVWASLDEVAFIRDREEHRAWAGCRFADRDAVLHFIAAGKGRGDNTNLLQILGAESEGHVEVQMYPQGARKVWDRGFMPTSPARLVLGTAWLEYRNILDSNTI
jgi:hypothetical protein